MEFVYVPILIINVFAIVYGAKILALIDRNRAFAVEQASDLWDEINKLKEENERLRAAMNLKVPPKRKPPKHDDLAHANGMVAMMPPPRLTGQIGDLSDLWSGYPDTVFEVERAPRSNDPAPETPEPKKIWD